MVSINNLSMKFGDRTVLKRITLEIPQGEIFAIMGSSGGGKTTLLRCVSGLLDPTEGHVTVDGINVQESPEEARRRMGMVFQSAALFDSMRVEQNVLFGVERYLPLRGEERVKWVRESLDRVGLAKEDATKMPSELSGGMKKRVGLARALALKPNVMLYDEPTTGLDPITTYTIDELIVRVREEGNVTSLLVSHDLSSVMRTADRVGFLHQGELVFVGPTADFEVDKHPAIRELVEKSRATHFEKIH